MTMLTKKNFTFIDTFRLSQKGNPLLSFHIQRTFEALQFLQLDISLAEVHKWYQTVQDRYALENISSDMKCRMLLPSDKPHGLTTEILPIETLPPVLTVSLSTDFSQPAGVGLQNYKTDQRQYWEKNSNSEIPDVIGVNTDQQVTETSRFNLFLLNKEFCYTPSLDSGCVNGCLRRFFIQQRHIHIGDKSYPILEKNILSADLDKYEIYVGNSLRGLLKANLIK